MQYAIIYEYKNPTIHYTVLSLGLTDPHLLQQHPSGRQTQSSQTSHPFRVSPDWIQLTSVSPTIQTVTKKDFPFLMRFSNALPNNQLNTLENGYICIAQTVGAKGHAYN